MAVVSCPECSKKLKIADTSVGKKVKCSCGNIFVAELEDEAPPPKKMAAVAAEKVFVACTECGAKLKVATTSLGKKMKCPKCASVFVANIEEDEAPPTPMPVKKSAKVAPKRPIEDEDEEEAPKSKAKGKAKPGKGDDEMDALFSFAQEEAEGEEKDPDLEDEEDLLDDDEDMPRPKTKAKAPLKGKGKPPRRGDDDDEEESPRKKNAGEDAQPVYPSRLLVNLLVFLLLLGWGGLFSVVYFEVIDIHDVLGIKRPARPLAGAPKIVQKIEPQTQDFVLARQPDEKKLLASYREAKIPPLADLPTYVLTVLAPSEAEAVGVAFSPAALSLATVSKDSIHFWNIKDVKDLKEPKPSRTIPVELKGTQPLVTYSPDGQFLAVVSGDEDNFLKVWSAIDAAKNKPLLDVALTKKPQAVAFSADGKLLRLVVREPLLEPELKTWDVAKWEESKNEQKYDKNNTLLLSPVGDKLLDITPGNILFVDFLVPTQNVKIKTDAKLVIPDGARVSPDGKSIAFVDPADDTKLQQLDLSKPSAEKSADVKTLKVESLPIQRLYFSPDGSYLLYETKDNEGKFQLLHIADQKLLPWTQTGPVNAFAFSPGGVLVAQTDDTKVRLLSFEDMLVSAKKPSVGPKKDKTTPTEKLNQPSYQELLLARQKQEKPWLEALRKEPKPDLPGVLASFPLETRGVGLVFSPAEPILVSVSVDSKEGVKFWDLNTKMPLSQTVAATFKGTRPLLSYSGTGDFLALASGDDKVLKVWKAADGSELKSVTLMKQPQALAFTADGKRLTLIAREPEEEPEIRWWNLEDGKEAKFAAPLDKDAQYLLSSDGEKVLEFTAEKLITHDLTTGKTKSVDNKISLQAGARLSPDGKYIVNPVPGDGGKTDLQLIDLSSMEESTLVQEKGPVERLQFSPDSKYLLYTADADHKLLEISSKKERWTATGVIDAFAFSPGGSFVARTDTAAILLLDFEEMLKPKKAETNKKDLPKTEGKKEPEPKADGEKQDKQKADDKKSEEKTSARSKNNRHELHWAMTLQMRSLCVKSRDGRPWA